jgi:hypothetical protein
VGIVVAAARCQALWLVRNVLVALGAVELGDAARWRGRRWWWRGRTWSRC